MTKKKSDNFYLTVDEFLERLIPGLREFIVDNNCRGDDSKSMHPHDLIFAASIYVDVACHVIPDFVRPHD